MCLLSTCYYSINFCIQSSWCMTIVVILKIAAALINIRRLGFGHVKSHQPSVALYTHLLPEVGGTQLLRFPKHHQEDVIRNALCNLCWLSWLKREMFVESIPFDSLPHKIHVWCIYLYIDWVFMINVGIYWIPTQDSSHRQDDLLHLSRLHPGWEVDWRYMIYVNINIYIYLFFLMYMFGYRYTIHGSHSKRPKKKTSRRHPRASPLCSFVAASTTELRKRCAKLLPLSFWTRCTLGKSHSDGWSGRNRQNACGSQLH